MFTSITIAAIHTICEISIAGVNNLYCPTPMSQANLSVWIWSSRIRGTMPLIVKTTSTGVNMGTLANGVEYYEAVCENGQATSPDYKDDSECASNQAQPSDTEEDTEGLPDIDNVNREYMNRSIRS